MVEICRVLLCEISSGTISGDRLSGNFRWRTNNGGDSSLEEFNSRLGSVTRLTLGGVIVEPERFIVDGSHVAVQAIGRATLASGDQYVNWYCFVFEFAHQKIASVFEYANTLRTSQVFAQVGGRPSS